MTSLDTSTVEQILELLRSDVICRQEARAALKLPKYLTDRPCRFCPKCGAMRPINEHCPCGFFEVSIKDIVKEYLP